MGKFLSIHLKKKGIIMRLKGDKNSMLLQNFYNSVKNLDAHDVLQHAASHFYKWN